MVAINGREVLYRAVNTLRTHYNRCLAKLFYGKSTSLGRTSSFVHPNLKRPAPKVAPLPSKRTWTQATPNGQVPKGRKQGRVKRKRYNDLAKDNSIVFLPGGFRKAPSKEKQKKSRQHADRGLEDDYEPIDCDPEISDEGQEQYGQSSDRRAADEDQAFVMRELNSLMFDKFRRESQFEAKEVSERVKKQAAERKARLERETKEAERLWKMEQLEKREERERTDRWKDQRLIQLKKEKHIAQTELAREKVERKQSKLQRVFKEQQQRRKDEERWKQLREKDVKLAAEREDNLLRENALLQNNVRAADNAFRRACNERDFVKQEKEEERARRLRAEESLHRWKELMKEYFPGGQQPQQHPGKHQGQQQLSLPSRALSLEAQFELYEKKWEVLRSGVDIDGTKVHLILFSQIPWPVANMTPTDPSEIRPEHIREFLMHPLRVKPDARGKRKNRRLRARDELMKWHSDRFDRVVLSKVRDEDKPAAFEAAGMIARVLTDMLS
ncbi:hypothetical protein BDM02DRAFT_3187228 [Thelephora ganbajun]|uniref:Uncharacterized protein n=1 Tax=Thelephora ganbajun TaxID=370292 RepID=A0ACB6ZFL8_THEGA|nr:hypothetical protein BDM02DRAFT_3187228 [Thelephora ganbajun]